jgi:hypothetical protein
MSLDIAFYRVRWQNGISLEPFAPQLLHSATPAAFSDGCKYDSFLGTLWEVAKLSGCTLGEMMTEKAEYEDIGCPKSNDLTVRSEF